MTVEIVVGDQVPVMPLLDVVGKVAGVAFWQYDNVEPKLNVGVKFGLTVTVSVTLLTLEHSPGFGVNV